MKYAVSHFERVLSCTICDIYIHPDQGAKGKIFSAYEKAEVVFLEAVSRESEFSSKQSCSAMNYFLSYLNTFLLCRWITI